MNKSVNGIGDHELTLPIRSKCPPFKSPTPSTDSVSVVSIGAAKSPSSNSSNPLLDALWRSPDRIHQTGEMDRETGKFKNKHAKDVNTAVERALAISGAGNEAYFACAEYLSANSRIATNASGAWAFWMDIDCGENKAAAGKGYLTEADAHVAVKQFYKDAGLPKPTHIVSSGGGLHMYWVLRNVVKREVWQAYAGKLKALTKALNFLADDTRTADIASVLRVPGTLNHKYDPARPVTLLYASDTFIEQSVMLDAIESAHGRLCSVDKHKAASPVSADKSASSGINWQASPSGRVKSPSQILVDIEAMFSCLSPDCGREDWIHVGMATKHETGGSEEGFSLWNDWSSKGKKYPGEKEIRVQWRSFRTDLANPITIATIRKVVADSGKDWKEVCAAADVFEKCETTVIHPGQKLPDVLKVEAISKAAPAERKKGANPLDRYSLEGMSEKLAKEAREEVPVLGRLALMGQCTVFYAGPNTGKTLIALSLLIEAIKSEHVDPRKVYYVNVDDNLSGLIQKLAFADEYQFHMLAEGYKGFSSKDFPNEIAELVTNDQANGVIIILDTLKKFTDLMDKAKSSHFGKVVRAFAMKGGTIIALAHVNKNPGRDGKSVHAGTTDIKDDFDCAYVIEHVGTDKGVKTVEFSNIKRRGNSILNAAYSYAVEDDIHYNELLLSVKSVDLMDIIPLKQAEQFKTDEEVISAVTTCIKDGVKTKMKLAEAAAKHAGISKRSALQIIDKYTGDDLVAHRWKFSVGERGAKVFILLDSAASLSSLDELKT